MHRWDAQPLHFRGGCGGVAAVCAPVRAGQGSIKRSGEAYCMEQYGRSQKAVAECAVLLLHTACACWWGWPGMGAVSSVRPNDPRLFTDAARILLHATQQGQLHANA